MEVQSINALISSLRVRGVPGRSPFAANLARRAEDRGDGSTSLRPEPAFLTEISEAGRAQAAKRADSRAEADARAEAQAEEEAGAAPNVTTGRPLTEEEQEAVRELRRRDAEVRRHEQAHSAAAGSLASGPPTYTYQTGPDGKRYAVSGEVKIDVSPVAGNPEATVQKMRQVQRAARAPAHPSAADLKVAATAAKHQADAMAEIRKERNGGSPYSDSDRAEKGRLLSISA